MMLLLLHKKRLFVVLFTFIFVKVTGEGKFTQELYRNKRIVTGERCRVWGKVLETGEDSLCTVPQQSFVLAAQRFSIEL